MPYEGKTEVAISDLSSDSSVNGNARKRKHNEGGTNDASDWNLGDTVIIDCFPDIIGFDEKGDMETLQKN